MAQLGGTTIAVGSSWKGHDVDSAVWISTDRKKWKLFKPPATRQAGQQQLVSVTTYPKGFFAAGNELTGRLPKPLILQGERSGLKRIELPPVAEFRGIRSISSDGKKGIVVLGVAGPIGKTRPVAWISDDAGKRWLEAQPFPTESSTEITGMARLGTTFYAVGAEVSPSGRSLAIWSSSDGFQWRRFRFDVVDDNTGVDRSKVDLVPVAVTPEGLLSLYDARARRSAMGFLGSGSIALTDVPTSEKGIDASAGPVAFNGRVVLFATGGAGRPNLSVWNLSSNDWSDDPDFDAERAESDTFPTANAALGASLIIPDPAGLGLLGVEFPVRTETVRSYGARPIAWIGPDGASSQRTIPKVAKGSVPVAAVTDGDVSYVFGFRPATDPAKDGLFDGAVWRFTHDGQLRVVATAGLGGPASQLVLGASRIGDVWVAVGMVAPDATGTRDAAIWTSTDAKAWVSTPGELGGSGDQSARAVCALPDGTPVVVGSASNEQGVDIPAAWYPGDSGWVSVQPAGTTAGSMERCASSPEGVIAVGSVGDAPGVWRTTDGAKWTRLRLPKSGPGVTQLSAVTGGPKGFVFAGSVDDGAFGRDIAMWVLPTKGSPRRLAAGPGFGGFETQAVSDLRLNGTTLTMAGSSGPAARVWQTKNIFAS